MAEGGAPRRIAILWRLTWDGSVLACIVYRDELGMLLRVESDSAVVVTERFDLQPRAVAKAQALRESLKRRGWQEAPLDASAVGPDTPAV